MSVLGRKRIQPYERDILAAYNVLARGGLDIGDDLKAKVVTILGREPDEGWGEPVAGGLMSGGFVEYNIHGTGHPFYEDGMVIKMGEVPDGTYEIRIYAE